MNRIIKIGTRGSKLAIRQAEIVKQKLQEKFSDIKIEIITIKTAGDKILNKTLDKIGGKGVFVKEIEFALLDKKIDIAVHSMKDMPIELPEGLMIGAVTERENPMDVLISKSELDFYSLPKGAKIGTGSLRRKVQLLSLRKDIEVVPIRGNIHTRIEKIEKELDGIVLAEAGLKRCGLENKISYRFNLNEMIPAACQGILALEIRKDDKEILHLVQAIHHEKTEICQKAERAFLKGTEADCHAPVGAFAVINSDNKLEMTVFFYSNQLIRIYEKAEILEAEQLGNKLARQILNRIREGE